MYRRARRIDFGIAAPSEQLEAGHSHAAILVGNSPAAIPGKALTATLTSAEAIKSTTYLGKGEIISSTAPGTLPTLCAEPGELPDQSKRN